MTKELTPLSLRAKRSNPVNKRQQKQRTKKERSKTMTKRAITGIIGTCCAIAVLAYAGTASATTMCVTNDNTNIILDPSIEGTDYHRDEATKTWTTTFPNYTVSGIATCNSTSGTYARAYPEYNFDNNHASSEGVYCWCRMTSPVRSAWVYGSERGSASECASDCARRCGSGVQGYSDFRRGVFGSAGN